MSDLFCTCSVQILPKLHLHFLSAEGGSDGIFWIRLWPTVASSDQFFCQQKGEVMEYFESDYDEL